MLEHLRLTWKHHAKALIVAIMFGLLAFAVNSAKLHVPVPATNVITDPREIFTILGASLAGPFWGMLVGFLAGVNDSRVDSLWLSSVPRMIACLWVGWFSARFVWQRKQTRTMLLSWILLVLSYYFVATAPTLLIAYFVAPDVFATISPGQTGFFDTVAAVYAGWATEIVLTMVVTSLVVLILPRKFLTLFRTRRGSNSDPEEGLNRIRGGVFEGKLSLKLTAWFLLLAMIPLAVVTVFVQDDVARGFLLVGAGKQREIAREFSRECAKAGYQSALKDRLVRTTGKTQNLFVVDKEGTYLAHSLQDKVGRNMREHFLEATVQRILAGTTGVAAEHESGTSIGYAPIGGTEWRVVSIEGKEVIAHSLDDLQQTISSRLAMSLLIIAVVWGIVIWLVVARPMRKLTMVTQEVGRGNLQALVEPSEMGGEIAALAQAFNEMTGHLRYAYHETESEIAQRKSTEETLREREQQFRLLAENSTDMISRHDLEGRYLYASPACRSLLGAAPEEIVGRSVYDFVYPEDVDAVAAHLKAHLIKRSAPPIIFRVRRIDGSIIWLESESRLVTDPATGTTEIHVSSRDVTQRMVAQLALRESEERLRTVVSNVPVVLFALDREGIFTLSEGKGLESLGLKPGQVVGQSVFEVYKDFPEILSQVRESLAGRSSVGVARVGTAVFETSYAPIPAADGTVNGMIGVASDVSARMQAEEAVRESEKMLKTLIHQSTDPIYLMQDNRLVFVNRAWEETFGYSAKEATGESFDLLRIVDPESRAHVEERLKRYSTGEPVATRYEMVGMRRNGSRVDVDVSVALISWQGKPAIQGIYRDITQRKRTEEAIRHKQKTESLGILAGGIAHDFNNLLQAMVGQISLALRRLAPENPAYESVLKAERAAERAADLTRQLLAYSGRGTFNVRPLDLNVLILENLHFLELAIPKEIVLEQELGNDLPLIRADAGQMQQVVMNLIINASEAIGRRAGTVSIRTSLAAIDEDRIDEWEVAKETLSPGSYLRLDVSDNGSGMSPDVVKKVFDPFFTTKVTGRGLGLSAVVGIVRAHRGALRVESKEGRGTTFSMIIPVTGDKKEDSGITDGTESKQKLQGCVLVIEDEPNVREVVSDMLNDIGVKTIAAASGEEGIEFFEAHPGEVNLVLLDLSMPGIGGKETFRRLKALQPDLKIVLSSGYSHHEVTEDFNQLVMDGFIQKPYRYESLEGLIQTHLGAPPTGKP